MQIGVASQANSPASNTGNASTRGIAASIGRHRRGRSRTSKVARRTHACAVSPSGGTLRSYKSKMARSLVIVESPAKAKTINKYLGRNFTVKASIGHVMDLPKKTIGIRLPGEDPSGRKKRKKKKGAKKGAQAEEKNTKKPITLDDDKIFEPTLQIIAGKGKVISDLRKAAHSAKAEAEDAPKKEVVAIDPKKIFRVTFNEITPKAIRAAFDKPRQVDSNLVDAQQARRVLDRIVGYKISPILWDKVRRGLSAGRVQTVALRLIVERELAIRAFVPQEYWTIHATLDAGQPPLFEAKLFKHKGEDIEVGNQEAADKIVAAVSKAKWQVASVAQKEKKRNPPPPFTTSKLQQAAYNRLRYTAKRTMSLAQKLYEGVELGDEGSVALITYMRTDSVHVSNDALAQVRELIPERFGPNYLPEKPNFYKSKKDAQEAHEAVRPTDVMRAPEDVRKYLDEDLFKLYQLIWQRFVASQMLPAIFDQTTIDINAGDYTFRATGSVQKFDGYLRVYQLPASNADRDDDEKDDEGEGRALPQVVEGQVLRLDKIRPDQHFTEPPPRFNDATLVKELEEDGIGRPSTYASIISTIVEREYVTKNQGRFSPTMLGERVSTLLVKSFEDIFDVTFTARLEEELDEIEEGKLPWREAVKEFWEKFVVDLDKAGDEMLSYKAGIPTGKKCENCGQEMAIKRGRFGTFLACTGYPDCKTTRRLVQGTRIAHQPDEPLAELCTLCGKNLVKKSGRFGEFIGCSGYPKCKYTRPITMGIKCPKCNEGEFVRRGSAGKGGRGRPRVFYGCSRYPDCDFTSPHMPIAEPCPKCGAPFIVEKRTKIGTVHACLKEGCDWEKLVPEAPTQAPSEEVPVPVAAKS